MAVGARDVARLLHLLLAVEADVSLRSILARAKCHELERVLAYVDRASAARAVADEAAVRRHAAAEADARSLENSLGDAIRRARRVRLQLATKEKEPKDDSDEDAEDTTELTGILAQARVIRLADGQATRESTSSTPPPASPPPTRIEYPRRMKTLLTQLADVENDERAQSFRASFCRKMTEHVSARECANTTTSRNDVRVQVGYARQVERLGRAFRRVGDFMAAKSDVCSDAVQKALQAPSMASVFPVFCRLHMARALLGALHDTTNVLAQQMPPRPSLSQATISHRDAMLQRFRKKTPTPSEAVATSSNLLLVETSLGSELAEHTALLEKLQFAWERELAATTNAHPYANTVNEAILSEMSTLVLSSFQTAFCTGPSAPSVSTIRELMSVIRVVESAVVHKGRRQRSVVQR